jgi:hypothetical protein
VLLLLEPGTPSGSAHIQRARSQLLDAAWQQQQQQQPGIHVVAPCPHDGACPLAGRASWCHFVQRFQASPFFAAQCCVPLRPGHFCLRCLPFTPNTLPSLLQRTQLQRAAKASAGIQPRTYQDERYSYVALAKCAAQ